MAASRVSISHAIATTSTYQHISLRRHVPNQLFLRAPLCPGDTDATSGTSIRRPYFVTAPRTGCWRELDAQEDDGDEDKEFVLQCQWDLDFL
jgi:hypothetical protein